jgi:alkaline phosphatase D
MMKKIIPGLFIFFFVGCLAQQSTEKPYLIVLSMDGFRWDYVDSFPTPNLHYIITNGVHARSLIPPFPSVTFPSHYTMATGLYPDHHGIIYNTFYDPDLRSSYSYKDNNTVNDSRYYSGEPIWVTAQKQNIKAASYFWPGSEAEIKGIRPAYWKKYTARCTYEQRIDTVIYWLNLPESVRPQLILFYFDNPDHLAHSYGPFDPKVRDIVMQLDSLVGIILNKINQLAVGKQVNLILVSDHGMEAINNDKIIDLDNYIHENWCDNINGHYSFITMDAIQGYSDQIFLGLSKVPHIKAWRKQDVPVRFHYGTNQHIGEFVLSADSSYSMTWSEKKLTMSGNHGYDNMNSDMHGVFFAIGPAFKKGYLQPPFENVNLYDIMTYVLQLSPANNDGNLEPLKSMFK